MWNKIPCSFGELNLELTLAAGQSFRWNKTTNNGWIGVMSGLIWKLEQDNDGNILYSVKSENELEEKSCSSIKRRKHMKNSFKKNVVDNMISNTLINHSERLSDYLNLKMNLEEYYKAWNKADDNFKSISNKYRGIRILRQEPVENLISFICSANNNIARITSMVEKLCSHYGKKILEFDGKTYYAFPTIKSLAAEDVEGTLRKLGFGYRAKYIHETAKFLLQNRSEGWLETLRSVPYKEAHAELMKLPGVGAKVADCVCLMSLDKYGAIPVDTHIWQVTLRDYLPHLKGAKTLTTRIYQEIGDFYRERFGEYAGWANTVLFAADLKKFKERGK